MRGIFEELKRRNVLRVAAAYAVVAWLVIQVAVAVFPVLGISGWATTMIVVLALAGFPITILISWFYEWTPEGIMTEEAATAAGYAKPAAFGRQIDFVIIALMAVAIGWLVWRQQGLEPVFEVDANSIAVLPFVDLSPQGDHEYFSDGIAEELLNVLAQVPNLRVAARTSSFRFKGEARDIPDIARQLNVAHVLEGSVRRGGDTVRITAQLIDAGTGFHLWSATYDRELTDIFAVQDEISAAIVAALSETLGLTLPSAPRVQQTANSAAYDAYLLGVLEMNRRNSASLEAAKQNLERALELDPDYAPAHARLSITLGLLPNYNNRYTVAGIKETFAFHTERAMALAPDAPESLAAKGFHAWYTNAVPLREVRAIYERVVELNPSYTDVLNWLANSSSQLGDYQAEIDIRAQALRIDPLNPLTVYNRAVFLINVGRFDEAQALIERLRTISPSFYWFQSATLAQRQGLTADAAIYHLEQLAVAPGSAALAVTLAVGLGLADEAAGLDDRGLAAMVSNGQIEEALRLAEDYVARGNTGPLGQVLLAAGRPGEAASYLNPAWDQALAIASVDRLTPNRLIDIGRARQMTGDQAGGEEALEAALAVIARKRAVGMNYAELDWDEGLARYFLGEKAAGLRLVARSVERRVVVYMLQSQYQPLTDDPAFATILATREAYAAAEREKFLAIVCNGGNPAPQVWTPKPETCAGYVEG